MVQDAKKRFPISLPSFHEKWLLYWAEMKGTTKTQLVQTILQEKIESNEGQIERMLEDRANDAGITVEELKQQILDKSSFEV